MKRCYSPNSAAALPYSYRYAEIMSVVPAKAGPRATDPGVTEKRPCVYILASRRNGTLYVGVTSDLAHRIWQHRSNTAAGLVRDYGAHKLVFVEFHETMMDAILREKRIKKWHRA